MADDNTESRVARRRREREAKKKELEANDGGATGETASATGKGASSGAKSGRFKDKKGRSTKPQDKRNVREKRRATGIIKLDGSMLAESDEEVKVNTELNETIAVDNPEDSITESKRYGSRLHVDSPYTDPPLSSTPINIEQTEHDVSRDSVNTSLSWSPGPSPRDSPSLGQSSRDSPLLGQSSRDSPLPGQSSRDSPSLGQSSRDSPSLGQSSRDSPLLGQSPRDSPLLGQSSRDSPLLGQSPRESPSLGQSSRDSPLLGESSRESPSLSQSQEPAPGESPLPEQFPKPSPRECPLLNQSPRPSPRTTPSPGQSPKLSPRYRRTESPQTGEEIKSRLIFSRDDVSKNETKPDERTLRASTPEITITCDDRVEQERIKVEERSCEVDVDVKNHVEEKGDQTHSTEKTDIQNGDDDGADTRASLLQMRRSRRARREEKITMSPGSLESETHLFYVPPESPTENYKKLYDRERRETRRLNRRHAEAEQTINRLQDDNEHLRKNLDVAEMEIERLREENDALVSAVTKLSLERR